MLNYLWAGMILVGVVFGAFNGRMQAITNAALDSSKEAVTLCIPFQVDSYLEYPVRTQEEARAIRESVDAEGAASLRDQGLRCWELDNGYLVVET